MSELRTPAVPAGATRQPVEARASADQPGLYAWYVVGLLALVNVFNSMDKMALAVLAPLIKVDLAFSDSQLGLLTGFAFALFYALCGIPIARWADRGVRRDIVALALATWSVMTMLCGAAQNFWQLLLARVAVGAGEAGSYSPGASILCDHLPVARRPGAFAVHAFGLVVGLMLGIVLAGWLGQAIGWRWAFVAMGVPGIVLAVIVRATLREPVRGRFDAVELKQDEGARSLGATIRLLWRCRPYRLLTFYLLINAFVQNGFTQWWPSYYARVTDLELSTIGTLLGVAIGAGMGAGLLLGGYLGRDRGRPNGVSTCLRICAATTCLALPALVGSLFVPSAILSMTLVALASVCWSVPSGPAMATVFSVTLPGLRATAGAVATFVVSLLGVGLGPLCVGLLSDLLRPSLGIDALRYALLAPAAGLPLIAVALVAAARSLTESSAPVRGQAHDSPLTAERLRVAHADARGSGPVAPENPLLSSHHLK